jgi:hypothetical protein
LFLKELEMEFLLLVAIFLQQIFNGRTLRRLASASEKANRPVQYPRVYDPNPDIVQPGRTSGPTTYISVLIACLAFGSSCAVAQESNGIKPILQMMSLCTESRAFYRNPDGSCVQCSIGMCGFNNCDPNAAQLLWDTEYGPAERGGSNPSRVESYCDRRGIRAWSVTGESVDDTIPWLRWAVKTRRFAAFGAGTRHFQTLYGYDYERSQWLVCNNNSTDRIDRYSESDFRELHRQSGPWCVILEKPASAAPVTEKWWK